jgi:acyl-CoA synthetase (NDP forming)
MDLVEQLDHIFYPRAVAVIGASANPAKPGFLCTSSLVEAGFKGEIYPVNPSLPELFGLTSYPSIRDVPGEVDLAVIVIPADQTISAIEECISKGVKGAILVSSGFSEVGSETGTDLQTELRDVANRGQIKIVGPNTLGLINLKANLNATFQPDFGSCKSGNVAVVSQSGGMCVYIIPTLSGCNVGISKAMGMGNRCNLDFDEMVTYLAQDEETKVIVLYIEGAGQPKRLASIAKEVVKRKPIVVYKGGRGEESNRATMSHTGALAGKYEFYKASFIQAGMIAVDSITQLVDITKALVYQPPAPGNRVAIMSVQAGPGIVMADKCRDLGLKPAQFAPATKRRLRQFISPLLPVDNPVDAAWIGSSYDASRAVLNAILEDDGVDSLIVAFTFFALSTDLYKAIIDLSKQHRKPIAVCLGSISEGVHTQIQALEDNHVPTYPLPERAVSGLSGLVRYGEILRATD